MFDDVWSLDEFSKGAALRKPLYDRGFWSNPGGAAAGAARAAAGGMSKENALLGAIMGEGSFGGMIGGGIGGAVGGAPGAVIGSTVGRLAQMIPEKIVEAASRGYSQADISSYAPAGGSARQTGMGPSALPQNVVAMFASMTRNIDQITKAGITAKQERAKKL